MPNRTWAACRGLRQGGNNMPPTRETLERFKEKYIPVTESGCWLWTASTSDDGYGYFGIGSRSIPGSRKVVKAHRFAYVYYKGEIPKGLELDHCCRVPCCVNPDHLEPVTHKVNVLRGIGPTAVNARKTHCINGHALTPENIYPGGRQCITCARSRNG